MNVNHEPFPLTYDHRSVSSLSLGDFNYLKAEVDYLRTTVEAMQLHFQTSLPSFHS
ncbi:hypothetical protein HMI54_014239 [Coelomomyces lativittatus]|nr:hypothetical protein HMI54_014239 [Coelomomyces lativittatus]